MKGLSKNLARVVTCLGLCLSLACGPSASQAPSQAVASPSAGGTLDGCLQSSDKATLVTFSAATGQTLQGAVLGNGQPGVVLATQIDNNLCAWLPFARTLRDRGARPLLFDFQRTYQADTEVSAAAAKLEELGARHVVLVGASFGGTASLVAATSGDPNLTGVVSVSGPDNYGALDATTAVAHLNLPLLFVVSRDDISFADSARSLYTTAASRDKKLEVLPGEAHGTSLVSNSPRARDLVLTFVSKHAGS